MKKRKPRKKKLANESIISKYNSKFNILGEKAKKLKQLKDRFQKIIISTKESCNKDNDLLKKIKTIDTISKEIIDKLNECNEELKKTSLELKNSIEHYEENVSFLVTTAQHYVRYNPLINNNQGLDFTP